MNNSGFIAIPPVIVGIIEVSPGVIIEVSRRPSKFHRLMMRLLLGWTYTDIENKKQMLYG